ncbi:PAS domain S-box protein, partial [Candidatus Nomurabacteria bacterium]|nr:PAS domain S-box protein [Candidatus Nomurabacteria bacterium]
MPFQLQSDPMNVFFRCVEDSSETIMITDKNGTLIYVNPAWTKTYGYTRTEVLGQTPRVLHSEHHNLEFYTKMWSDILNIKKGYWKGEVINRAKDRTLIPVLLTITTFKSLTGEILGFMGIALDIHEQKQLEDKVVHQDRLASIGLLSSGLAHEIGTPLGVIRGRAEILQTQTKDTHIKNGLDVIISQIDRISKLIGSLLRVSRSSTDVKMTRVNVLNVVNDVLALVRDHFKKDSVEVKVNISQDLFALADFSRLEQVLLNLTMNSIHAIQKSIKDCITHTPHVFSITSGGHMEHVCICVSDTGCGISKENMKKLFQPFFTTKKSGE